MRNKFLFKTVIILVIMLTCIMLAIIPSNAADNYYVQSESGKTSTNVSDNNYSAAATTVKSYLQVNSDGTINRIEYIDDSIVIETYNSSFKLQSTKTLEKELSSFGGFYSGEKYNFLVFGQNNPNEDDTVEVMRVVKYSKTWQKLGTASVKGENTYQIFASGSCRMTELDGVLFVDTAHTMYTSSDGLHHQSNMLVKIDEETMNINYCRSGVMNISSTGYVSHSFNQFILTDGDYIYTIDHGDAYPRAVSICKTLPDKISPENVALALKILGDTDSTATGVSVGGTELSANNCLIAGNSLEQQETLDFNKTRNIFLTVTPKDNLSTNSTTIKWLTNYDDTREHEVYTPHLVKINDNKFLIMWEEETNNEYGQIKMVLVDGSGNTLSKTITIGGRLSDCKPVIYNNKVTWYVTVGGAPIFFSIDVSTTSKFEAYNNQNVMDYSIFSDYYTYVNSNGEILAYQYIGYAENVTVPNITYPWIKITLGANIFANCKTIKNVVLPEGIEEIPEGMFYKCSNLTTVNIPSTVKTIGQFAFWGSGIKSITIPNTVTSIGASAFRECENLTTAKLSTGVTELPEYMFYYSEKLTNVTIPSTVVTIGNSAFAHTGITKITIPSSVKKIESYAFYGCYNLTGIVTIPSNVTSIGDSICEEARNVDKLEIKNPNATVGIRLLVNNRILEEGETYKAIEGVKIIASKSNDENVATVTRDGTITAVGEGGTTIYYYNSNNELVGATILTVTERISKLPFTDVSVDDWFYSSVEYTYQKGIILGTSNTTFNPNTKLTRGMLVTILHRMDGKPTPTTQNKFSDVYRSQYYYDAVIWANEKGIVHGYGDGSKFGPDDNITRQDLAVILRNFAQYKGKNINVTSDLSKFKDGNLVSDYAKTAMQWATGKGVITGNNNGESLTPHANSTRAEAAGMIYNYCTKVKDEK